MVRQRFSLSLEETDELRRVLQECPDEADQVRVLAIMAYGGGQPLEAVRQRLGCSRTSLFAWCRSYRLVGPESLMDGRCGGNNARLTSAQVEDLMHRLRNTTPQQLFGASSGSSDGATWTVKDLYRVVQQWYGVIYCSPSSYYALLVRFKKQAQVPT